VRHFQRGSEETSSSRVTPATQPGMLSNSEDRIYHNAGAMGLRPTKHQSGAEKGSAGSHGSHHQRTDTSLGGTRPQREGIRAVDEGWRAMTSRYPTIVPREPTLFAVRKSAADFPAPASGPGQGLASCSKNVHFAAGGGRKVGLLDALGRVLSDTKAKFPRCRLPGPAAPINSRTCLGDPAPIASLATARCPPLARCPRRQGRTICGKRCLRRMLDTSK
jgi:hypothetical protein